MTIQAVACACAGLLSRYTNWLARGMKTACVTCCGDCCAGRSSSPAVRHGRLAVSGCARASEDAVLAAQTRQLAGRHGAAGLSKRCAEQRCAARRGAMRRDRAAQLSQPPGRHVARPRRPRHQRGPPSASSPCPPGTPAGRWRPAPDPHAPWPRMPAQRALGAHSCRPACCAGMPQHGQAMRKAVFVP